tara:strand:- start:301 stop:864 length:564 start_codon:yes stop_codon:yes gene_type:complete
MAEEVKNTQQAEENRETNPSTQAAEKQDVPYGRFQEKNTQWNERGKIIEQKDDHIAKLEAEKEGTRQEALRKAGDIETLLKESQTKNVKYEETIKQQGEELGGYRTGLVDQVPEERRYITDGMSIANLQKFVSDEQTTANAGKTDSSRAGTTVKGEMGGYDSWQEFAIKDPKNAEKAIADSTANYIK